MIVIGTHSSADATGLSQMQVRRVLKNERLRTTVLDSAGSEIHRHPTQVLRGSHV